MKQHVFVIDDDRDNAESIADLLELRGYDVSVAHSGEEAIARFMDDDFDLVLLDIKLPGINGVETFLELRKMRPEVAVMLMTGYSVEELVKKALSFGALGVLRKPFPVTDLLKLLDHVQPRGVVLIADDDADFVTSIAPVLRSRGYMVEVARSGQEALDRATSDDFTCLVLDVRMPVLSGLDVYSRLKQAGRVVPTVIVTGFADEDPSTVSQLQAEAEALLVKPFDPAELLRALETAMGSPGA